MDAQVWKESQRTGFPFTLTLNQVISMAALTPVVFYSVPTTTSKINWPTLQILLITLAISVVAYLLSQNLIMRFKDTLCKKGLFGKDLNKAGERETKEKV